MNLMRRFTFAAFLLLAFGSIAYAQGRITSAAVWQMPSTFLADAHKACDNAPHPPSFADCFIAQMASAGAPPAAVAFTRRLFEQNGGDVGILTGFHPLGRVDVGF